MDLRSLIELLDSNGELIRVKAEVDPEYELGALLRQAEQQGKACWFERVRNATLPAVGGVMTSPKRHALGIGKPADALARPGSHAALLRTARENPIKPMLVEAGPVSDVVLTGDQIDMTALPIPKFFSGDSHKFITAGIGFSMDAASGHQNVGFYRQPVIDAQHIAIGASPNSNLTRIMKEAQKQGPTMPIAIVIGAPPSLLIAAGSRMPSEISDIGVAGALEDHPIELVRCHTSDLLVPANAELIIEAQIDFSSQMTHTMGEYGDQYGATTSHSATITAVSHRHDAVFHIIMGGMNREHNELGVIIFDDLRRELLDYLAGPCPFVTDLSIDFTPRRGGLRAQLAVAIDKTDDHQPQEVISEIFGFSSGRFPMARILQRIVIVNQDIDISNRDDIEWAISSRVDRREKLHVYDDKLPSGGTIARIGIDATMDMANQVTQLRPVIPGAEKYRLDDYL